MFGIPKREALLLRRGRWDVLVIQLVAFDIKAMHTLIRSLDFLALVKSARVAVDLSHNHAVDSCVLLTNTPCSHHVKPSFKMPFARLYISFYIQTTSFKMLTSFLPTLPFAPPPLRAQARCEQTLPCPVQTPPTNGAEAQRDPTRRRRRRRALSRARLLRRGP